MKIEMERCLLKSGRTRPFILLAEGQWRTGTQALTAAWIILAYLLGSVPVGVLLSRLKGQDPRNAGSGNIGATNVMRTAGKTLGAVTLMCDVLKGFLPVWLAIAFGLSHRVTAEVGLAAFLGHLFPVYLRFKGGKGVATAVGIFLAFNWFAVLIDLAVFVLVLDKWRYVSLGSMVGAALMPFLLYGVGAPTVYIALAAIMAVLIIIKHRANIGRLREGKESRIGKPRPEKRRRKR